MRSRKRFLDPYMAFALALFVVFAGALAVSFFRVGLTMIGRGALAENDERKLCRAFAALSTKARLDVVRLLVDSGEIGSTAGAIANQLGLSPSNASFHLKELEHAGLIVGSRTGRSIIYVTNNGGLREIVGFLSELRSTGSEDAGVHNGASAPAGDPTCHKQYRHR